MQVLVATTRSQGAWPNDYSWCVPGELLWITEICDRDRRDPEQGCGCGRAFGGLTSHRATTTAEVVERDMSQSDFRLALQTSLADQGWLSDDMSGRCRDAILDEEVGLVLAISHALPPGTIVRRDLDEFHAYPPRPVL